MFSLFSLLLELVVAAVSLLAGLSGLYDVAATLKAKSLAKKEIHKRVDPKLDVLVDVAVSREFDDAEMIVAIDFIKSSIGTLSRNQRSRIERGLRQGNRAGERRYVRELILAA